MDGKREGMNDNYRLICVVSTLNKVAPTKHHLKLAEYEVVCSQLFEYSSTLITASSFCQKVTSYIRLHFTYI